LNLEFKQGKTRRAFRIFNKIGRYLFLFITVSDTIAFDLKYNFADKEENMKINFTKEQYELLLKIVYMGNGMINSVADESEENEFDDLEGYIFSFAKDFDLGRYVEYDKEDKAYYPSQELEEDETVIDYIQRYDDNIFWDKLLFNLIRRDMAKEHGEDAVEKMSEDEYLLKEKPFVEKYVKEFGKNGLMSLTIKKVK